MAKTTHQKLFNQKVLTRRISTIPTPQDHKASLHEWAQTIRTDSISKEKETSIRSAFLQLFFLKILGYKSFGTGLEQTIKEEASAGVGSADAVLGRIGGTNPQIVAAVELKGASTRDLDAIMPSRNKSPVQQGWEYAMDIPGCQFIVLTNMVEIRLYAVGFTRVVYESFNILDIADSDTEYQKFILLLSANSLLNGITQSLLVESAEADKEITKTLYRDYKKWRLELIISISSNNQSIDPNSVIEYAQTILDRVLFIAFAEDRELLPRHTLANAFAHRDPYNPKAVWENFKGLFAAIDKGNEQLNIPAYNGGLFRRNQLIDNLKVPDETCESFKNLGAYDFASEISVTVLGHIFEQSISDIEVLNEKAGNPDFDLASLQLENSKNETGVSGKRKNEGVIYTPDEITAFIVERTLGEYLSIKKAEIQRNYLLETNSLETIYRKATQEEKKKIKVKDVNRLTEFMFYFAWRETLKQIKILDPACGSGAFLVAAFDLLDLEYKQVNEQIQAITGNIDLFDIGREILNSNLYGVDLNPESIEISKLSLWLKTAQRGKPLQSLEANLRVGNSLINELGSEYSNKSFNWNLSFPQVFETGGFDVILGNPPYVRMELLKPIKSYLETHYKIASDRADLYCYFYELGINLLKPEGFLGYISSSTFFKNGSGQKLRDLLAQKTKVKYLIDFGDVQIFEGVATLPAIVIAQKILPDDSNQIRALKLDFWPETGLTAEFEQKSSLVNQTSLNSTVWRIEEPSNSSLRTKIAEGKKTLKEVYGSPYYGIKTGCNKAFVIDSETKTELILKDPKSAELIKPALEGKSVKRWFLENKKNWLIYIPKGQINIEDYPAIYQHLLPFKKQLEARATKQAWFELQQPQTAYLKDYEGVKVIYPEFSRRSAYLDKTGYFINNKIFYIKGGFYELGLFNSNVFWYLIKGLAPIVIGGSRELRAQYIETLPIPSCDEKTKFIISTLAETCQNLAEKKIALQESVRNRIFDLIPSSNIKISEKLIDWWNLDFQGMRREIKKITKDDIPLKERDAWENYLNNGKNEINNLNSEILSKENSLNTIIYKVFDLSKDDILIIEKSEKYN